MKDLAILAGLLLAAAGPSLVGAQPELASASAVTSAARVTSSAVTASVSSSAAIETSAAAIETKFPQSVIDLINSVRSRRRFRVPPPLPTSSAAAASATTGFSSTAVPGSTGESQSDTLVQNKRGEQESRVPPRLTPRNEAGATPSAPRKTASPTLTDTVRPSVITSTTTQKPAQTSGVPIGCTGKKCRTRPGRPGARPPKKPCTPKKPLLPKPAASVPKRPRTPDQSKAGSPSAATITVTRTAAPSSAIQAAAVSSAVRGHLASSSATDKNLGDRGLREPGAGAPFRDSMMDADAAAADDLTGQESPYREGQGPPRHTRTGYDVPPVFIRTPTYPAQTRSSVPTILAAQAASAEDLEEPMQELKCDCRTPMCPCGPKHRPLVPKTTFRKVVLPTATKPKRHLPAPSALTATPSATTYARLRCPITRRPNCSRKTSSTSASSSSSTPSSAGPVTVTVTVAPPAASTSTSSRSCTGTTRQTTPAVTPTSTSSSSSSAGRVTVTVTATPDYTPTYVLNPRPTRAVKAREVEHLEDAPPESRAAQTTKKI